MDEEKYRNRVAVVTGAGGTLCSEMARELGRKGMKIALLGRTPEKLEKVENEIRALGGTAISVSVDVTDLNGVIQARDIVREKLGNCMVLINGAGGNQAGAITSVTEFSREELNQTEQTPYGFFNLDMDAYLNVIKTNTMGTVIPCRVFGEDMVKAGGGSIINMASMNSYRALSKVSAYGMSKAAVTNFTQWLATYLAPAGIRVNAIAPGFFLNERSRKLLLTSDEKFSPRGSNIIAHTPMRRFGEASELLGCLNWLIDDGASGFVTGVTIPIDGGFMANPGV